VVRILSFSALVVICLFSLSACGNTQQQGATVVDAAQNDYVVFQTTFNEGLQSLQTRIDQQKQKVDPADTTALKLLDKLENKSKHYKERSDKALEKYQSLIHKAISGEISQEELNTYRADYVRNFSEIKNAIQQMDASVK
jgi:hypothetical protein